jgi:hypothetical protein
VWDRFRKCRGDHSDLGLVPVGTPTPRRPC